MKKILLSLRAAAVAVTASAGLVSAQKRHLPARASEIYLTAPFQSTETVNGPQKAAGTMTYGLAGELNSVVGFQNATKGLQVAQAFEMTPAVSTQFAGSQITAINTYTGMNVQTRRNNCTLYTAFIIEGDQENAPIATSATFASRTAGASVKIDLQQPVTIEAGKTYYIGTYCTLTNQYDYQVTVDGLQHNGIEGGWVATRSSDSAPWTWDNVTEDYGFVCVSATITGDNLPEDIVSVEEMSVPVRVRADNKFEIGFLYENQASNDVTSIEYTYTVGTNEPVTGTATPQAPVAYGSQDIVWITDASFATPGKDAIPVTVTVTKVNGNPNNGIDGSSMTATTTVLPKDCDNVQNVVIEEATSTGCVYCPYGIIALEKVRETYTDGSFIPVAVHWHFSQSSLDPMTVDSFYDLYAFIANAAGGGIPAASINRIINVPMGWIQAFDYMQDYYNQLHSAPALVGMGMNCHWEEGTNNLVFDVTNKFAFDYDKHNYRLSFVITEDGMGPYNQSNGLRGSGTGTEWDTKPSTAPTIFNDVARMIDTYKGIAGSIPATIEAGKEYTYTHKLTMSDAVLDPAKINAICYVIDSATNEIVNATMVYGKDIVGESGICDVVTDDSEAPVEYYNLQGIRVNNPEGGVFIRRQGNTVTKVIK